MVAEQITFLLRRLCLTTSHGEERSIISTKKFYLKFGTMYHQDFNVSCQINVGNVSGWRAIVRVCHFQSGSRSLKKNVGDR